jgi:AbrB family looped-hinge helix DNA binding protein
MPKVRLNYDGWLALPAAARRALGVDTGDQLEIEVADGRIVLRPPKTSAAAGSPADEELPPAAAEPEAATAATAPSAVKQGPGRPRKAIAAPSAAGTV